MQGTSKFNAAHAVESRNTPSCFMLLNPEMSTGLIAPLVSYADFSFTFLLASPDEWV